MRQNSSYSEMYGPRDERTNGQTDVPRQQRTESRVCDCKEPKQRLNSLFRDQRKSKKQSRDMGLVTHLLNFISAVKPRNM